MHGSVTECLRRAKLGESFAQVQLFDRYRNALVSMVGRRMRGAAEFVGDADDVVSQAFYDLLAGAVAGRFRKLDDRRDLWQILLTLTRRRAISERRHATARKRRLLDAGFGEARGESSVLARSPGPVRIDEAKLLEGRPSPALAVQLQEEFAVRLEQLDDEKLRAIAISKLAGFSNQEIAKEFDCSLRSIERKLALIRRAWEARGQQ